MNRKGVSQSFRLSVLGQLVRIDVQLLDLVPHQRKNLSARESVARLKARREALLASLEQHDRMTYTERGSFAHLGRQGVIARAPELVSELPREVRP